MVPANRVAWTPAGVVHYHRAYGQTDMRILFLPASLARLLPKDSAVLPASPLAREALLALTGPRNDTTDAHRFLPGARVRLRRALLDELQGTLELPLQLPEPRDDRLQAIARRLYETPADNTRLNEFGRAIGASPRTLSRLFHDELGMTFHEWRTQVRVHHALVMLADGRSTTDVSLACGWANPSHFIAAFTKITGTSPGRYRANSGRPASGSRSGAATSPEPL